MRRQTVLGLLLAGAAALLVFLIGRSGVGTGSTATLAGPDSDASRPGRSDAPALRGVRRSDTRIDSDHRIVVRGSGPHGVLLSGAAVEIQRLDAPEASTISLRTGVDGAVPIPDVLVGRFCSLTIRHVSWAHLRHRIHLRGVIRISLRRGCVLRAVLPADDLRGFPRSLSYVIDGRGQEAELLGPTTDVGRFDGGVLRIVSVDGQSLTGSRVHALPSSGTYDVHLDGDIRRTCDVLVEAGLSGGEPAEEHFALVPRGFIVGGRVDLVHDMERSVHRAHVASGRWVLVGRAPRLCCLQPVEVDCRLGGRVTPAWTEAARVEALLPHGLKARGAQLVLQSPPEAASKLWGEFPQGALFVTDSPAVGAVTKGATPASILGLRTLGPGARVAAGRWRWDTCPPDATVLVMVDCHPQGTLRALVTAGPAGSVRQVQLTLPHGVALRPRVPSGGKPGGQEWTIAIREMESIAPGSREVLRVRTSDGIARVRGLDWGKEYEFAVWNAHSAGRLVAAVAPHNLIEIPTVGVGELEREIRVLVNSPDGRPAPRVTVEIGSPLLPSIYVQTDEQGTARVSLKTFSEYVLSVNTPVWRSRRHWVVPGESRVTLDLRRLGTIRLSSQSSTSRDILVELRSESGTLRRFEFTLAAGASHEISGLILGRYSLTVKHGTGAKEGEQRAVELTSSSPTARIEVP